MLADSDGISPVPPYSGYRPPTKNYPYGTFTLCGSSFQTILVIFADTMAVLQPQHGRNPAGLGYFRFARHYSGNYYCSLFLSVLRCFSSRGSLSLRNDCSSNNRVSPFGDLRITPCFPVPATYRRLPRPSSPLRAKASLTHPSLISNDYLMVFFPSSFHVCQRFQRAQAASCLGTKNPVRLVTAGQ